MPTQKRPVSTGNAKSTGIKDDVYSYSANELVQIRRSPSVYLGSDSKTGALHLVNEIVTNSIDECTNPSSMGDTIWITFFEKECRVIIEDNGRGIPLNILADVVSKKHYSTKFDREFNRYSGGQNGVGTTITAAMSDFYKIQCWREGQSRTVHLESDHLVDEGLQKCKDDKHGTYTEFIPSKKWLGKFDMEVADMDDYIRRLSYVMPDKVKIKYRTVNKKGKEAAKTVTRKGIAANVEYLSQSLEFNPVLIAIPEQTIRLEDEDDVEYFKLEFAFSYDRTTDETVTASFCDYVATKEGGTHEQVVIQALSSFFVRQAKALDPNAKYEVTSDDCKKGLIMAVNCDHSNPKFEGQHKSKVSQKNIITYGRAPIMDALGKFFETNNGLLRKIIIYLRMIARIRQDSHKVKTATIKKASTFLDDAEIKMFKSISDRNYSGYKEIIISEGDSSISALDAARNVVCQAIFGIRGVVTNTYGMSTNRVLESDTFRALTQVLGCGIDANFDLEKLKYDAVIIGSDSDVDGNFIASLICVFFACHMPGIVTSGKLYRVLPPLYRLDAKKMKSYGAGKDYIFDKKEYYDLFHKVIANSLKVKMVEPKTQTQVVNGAGEVTELTKKQLLSVLDATTGYLDELRTLQKRSFCNRDVLEYICYFLVMTQDAPKGTFEKLLHKKFPELNYAKEFNSIMGSYEGENISLIVDDIFLRMAHRLMHMIANLPAFYLLVKNAKDKEDPRPDKYDLMTFGQFMEMCDKSFMIDIEQRYKGIGEGKADITFPSMMNPKTRRLVRITMDDIEDAMKTIYLLHGPTEEMRKARREMLDKADITLADIDN